MAATCARHDWSLQEDYNGVLMYDCQTCSKKVRAWWCCRLCDKRICNDCYRDGEGRKAR